jgi:hypothetical protein
MGARDAPITRDDARRYHHHQTTLNLLITLFVLMSKKGCVGGHLAGRA